MAIHRPKEARASRSKTEPSPHALSPGLRVLIPGYAQWCWRQPERAIVLFGSFSAALAVATFAWGTRTGMAVLLFAFAAHVASVLDVVRQSAFPGFGRWMPLASASGGLALGVYGPVVAVASVLAWPAGGGESDNFGYLINCWTYRNRAPGPGECVWVKSAPGGADRVSRVLARAGDEVRWSNARLWVNGQPLLSARPVPSPGSLGDIALTVPDRYVLLGPLDAVSGLSPADGLELAPASRVRGRAWAQFYPLWDRRLLP
jgi:hypothetical protein